MTASHTPDPDLSCDVTACDATNAANVAMPSHVIAAKTSHKPENTNQVEDTDDLLLSSYDYDLPEALIARYPLPKRSASRLMYVPAQPKTTTVSDDKADATPDTEAGIQDMRFTDLPRLLRVGDLLVFNDTKVMKARLFGSKDTGGQIEVLIERLTDERSLTQGHEHVALAHVRASKAPKAGQHLTLAAGAMQAQVLGRKDNLFVLAFAKPILPDLEQYGEIPIPPYFERRADASDDSRYQTVFHDPSKQASVAAPTASLHFDEALLTELATAGIDHTFVTLHVGAGTFAPVKTDDLRQHTMHSEYAELTASAAAKINATRRAGGRIIAVGTTVTRVLETAYLHACADASLTAAAALTKMQTNAQDKPSHPVPLQAWAGDTDIFIYPSFRFGVVDKLITNFHLPKSTLLMLVAAFIGKAQMQAAYRHAIAHQYRFFSYGDAMLLDRLD